MSLAVLVANLGAQKHDADSRLARGRARSLVGTTGVLANLSSAKASACRDQTPRKSKKSRPVGEVRLVVPSRPGPPRPRTRSRSWWWPPSPPPRHGLQALQHPTTNQVGGQYRQLFILAIGRAIFNRHVPALDMAAFVQPLAKRRQLARASHRRDRVQYSDHRQCRLLRPRSERPRRRARSPRDELPPSHRSFLQLLHREPIAVRVAWERVASRRRGQLPATFFAAREAGYGPQRRFHNSAQVRCWSNRT
jgi:hypothetical protein